MGIPSEGCKERCALGLSLLCKWFLFSFVFCASPISQSLKRMPGTVALTLAIVNCILNK